MLIANEPLTISNREMVSVMFRNQHPETSGFDFSSPIFAMWRPQVIGKSQMMMEFCFIS